MEKKIKSEKKTKGGFYWKKEKKIERKFYMKKKKPEIKGN